MTIDPLPFGTAPAPSGGTLYLQSGVWQVGDYARDSADVIWQLCQDEEGEFYWSCGPHPDCYVRTWLEELSLGPTLPIQKVIFVALEERYAGRDYPVSYASAIHMATAIFKDIKIGSNPEHVTDVIVAAAKKIMAAEPSQFDPNDPIVERGKAAAASGRTLLRAAATGEQSPPAGDYEAVARWAETGQ